MIADAELAPVRADDQLDWAALEAWLRAAIADLPPAPMQVGQFARGHANLTYLITFADRQLVLRRPPHGAIAPGAHDMGREYRVLAKLWQAWPRAPRAHALCEDESVIGARFVVQDYRAGGEVFFKARPASMEGLPHFGERITRALAEALADLHKVDYAAIGLADFGRPEGYLERQLAGWHDRWRRVASAQPVPGLEDLGERLARDVPRPLLATIVHNDFKLDNCQFRPGEPDRVVAVFDWDMATIGDPLVDVGIALDYWPLTHGNPALGLPPGDAFKRHYAAQMGIDVAAIAWYEAFAAWRSGIATQQMYHRFVSGQTSDARMQAVGRRVVEFAARGKAALDAA
ncbi:phosphotransferase family protein [Novosphingobium bradum]|uniref:Phosphotransferase family protein n=1 Tax=Novosphingobium bradum TaxID=1737444 RepID=A0ABV7IIV6_9SPHN